ncbi:bactericidal permeability-increasing protein-like [Chanodichthys erythropterus]|uniref:bactericidal permeability-increasing protein-like n=1 Tax=Chanodichthys erythropterus TaxID=933992 RepID=UPI00351E31B3
MMFLGFVLVLVNLVSVATDSSAGVKVTLTQKGLEYGRQLGIDAIQQKLGTIKLSDISGSANVVVGNVEYSLTGMQIGKIGLGNSAVGLVPGTGVKLSVANGFINMRGNWEVKYFWFIKLSGSFELSVSELAISTNIAVKNDVTGRPTISIINCAASVGSVNVRFDGGPSWLFNLFACFINTPVRNILQEKICPLVADSIPDMNRHLNTLNVLAKVDENAEIEYSMVGSPVISNTMIEFGLKGEFYNIGQHTEPPFSPTPFSLVSQATNMLYLGVSAFSINSAGFVYHRAGALRHYITDDMIPSRSLFRLDTKTFGIFIPQMEQMYPGLMMKLLFETVKEPNVTLQPNNMTVQASGRVTAYAIQPNSTLSPVFVLNLEASVSANMYVTELKLAGNVILNKFDMNLETSNVGQFEVTSLSNIFTNILNFAVIPKINAHLQGGFPLPAIGKMKLMNTQLQVLKDYLLIGTDVQII